MKANMTADSTAYSRESPRRSIQKMEVTFDALDWGELQKFGDSMMFAEWRLELGEEPEWLKSSEDIGWLNDIAGVYLDIADAIYAVHDKLPVDQQDVIKNSLMTVMCGDDAITRRDFTCIPESCYFISLSPETISEVHRSLKHVRLDGLSKLIAVPLAKEWEVDDPTTLEEGLLEYFSQVTSLVDFAASRHWGVIGHMG